MGLQPVALHTACIGKRALYRHDTTCAHFSGFLDDEISARLFDGRKDQPQVRWQLQRFGLLGTDQHATALACLGDLGTPFAIGAVKQQDRRTDRLAHHAKEVMRLRLIQRNGLPLPQWMIYIKSDFSVHGLRYMHDTSPTPDGNDAARVVDAPADNWVDRSAPRFTRPFLRLSRADRPIGTWLLLLPCWWGLTLAMLFDQQPRWFDLWIFIGCGAGAWLMRGAGCTWNDITDRHIDGKVARTRSRPIPSGQVSVKGALAWMIAQMLIALCILLSFNGAAIALGVLALLPVAIYPFAKRFTWWPQVFLGIAFNWGALLAWTAHTGSLGAPAVVLYVAGIAWTLFYDTIYAHQDKEDDALIGVKSTARLFGDNTAQWLRRFLMGTVGLMGLAVIFALRDSASFLALIIALCGPWAMGWHMAWQLRSIDINDNDKLLRLFRVNRDTGMIPLVFFAAALLA